MSTPRVVHPYVNGRGPKPLTIKQKLARRSERQGDCLVWTGPVDKDGYGKVPVGRHGFVRAHRAAWIDANGEPPDETPDVLHTCDNPPCFWLVHLYPGTQAQNMLDRLQRGRWAGGRPAGGAR